MTWTLFITLHFTREANMISVCRMVCSSYKPKL